MKHLCKVGCREGLKIASEVPKPKRAGAPQIGARIAALESEDLPLLARQLELFQWEGLVPDVLQPTVM